MSDGTARLGLGDVLVALALFVLGLPLAASMLFLFVGAPMVMAGVEILTSPAARVRQPIR